MEADTLCIHGDTPGAGRLAAAGLRVFPPNQRASKTIPFPFPACGRTGGPGFLKIGPVTR